MNTQQSGVSGASDLRVPLLSIPSPSASRHSRDGSGGLEDFSSCLDRFSDDRGRDRAGQPPATSNGEPAGSAASASSAASVELEEADDYDFTELSVSDDLNPSATASNEAGPVNPDDGAPVPFPEDHPKSGDCSQSDGSEAAMRASAKDASETAKDTPKSAKDAAGSDAKVLPATAASGKAGEAIVAKVVILPTNAAGRPARAAQAVVAKAARDVESPAVKQPTIPVADPAKEAKAMVYTEQKTVWLQTRG